MKKAAIVTFAVGLAAGVVALASFNTVMQVTSTEEFCGSSCHEMGESLDGLRKTIHYSNKHGVAVTCSDCHIPREFIPKMIRKIQASREVWGHFTGVIDTPEKYAAHLPVMREREVNRLRASDSRECRNCHKFERMDLEAQSRMASRRHSKMKERDKTCIDCHSGIAHPSKSA